MDVPVPFTFNALKHHLKHAKDRCQEALPNETSFKQLVHDLNNIGSNLLDVYTGDFSAREITNEITGILKTNECFEKVSLTAILNDKGYMSCKISDKSIWIVRFGSVSERYIHIHPGRVGENVQRFHSNAWKTAILLYYFNLFQGEECDSTEQVNSVRTKYLGLSPVKKLSINSRIFRIFNQLVMQDPDGL